MRQLEQPPSARFDRIGVPRIKRVQHPSGEQCRAHPAAGSGDGDPGLARSRDRDERVDVEAGQVGADEVVAPLLAGRIGLLHHVRLFGLVHRALLAPSSALLSCCGGGGGARVSLAGDHLGVGGTVDPRRGVPRRRIEDGDVALDRSRVDQCGEDRANADELRKADHLDGIGWRGEDGSRSFLSLQSAKDKSALEEVGPVVDAAC